MAEVVFDHVSKRYDNGVYAVRDLDLEVADGEFLVLVGPSGCGKSTALRMVAGLEEISDGRLRIGDRIVNDLASKDRDIAMVFQSYALYPHMTVAENIGYGLRIRRVPGDEIDRLVRAAAEKLDLVQYLDRRPKQLSGGQRQRVAMGRAIVRQPKVFLMDEPLSNLDAKLRGQMRSEIARIQRDAGVTTIYVTHDQVEAMTMGHRVAVLRGGVLQQVAEPSVLYASPDNLFVAGFIGSPPMNLAVATLLAEGDAWHLDVGGHRLALPHSSVAERPALAGYAGRDVVVGVRSEDLGEAPDAADGTSVVGEVTDTEALGSEVMVHVRVAARPVRHDDVEVASGAPAGGVSWIASFGPRTRVRIGDQVRVAVDAAQLHLFDPVSGAAIRA